MYLWLTAWKSDSMHDGGRREHREGEMEPLEGRLEEPPDVEGNLSPWK